MGALSEFVQKAFKTSPKNLPTGTALVSWPDRGRVAKSNVQLFRNWSEHSEWVRAAIQIRKSQVASAEWDIGPFDQEKDYPKRTADRITKLLNAPDAHANSFSSFIEPIIEDILVLDAGVIEKDRNLLGEIAQLHRVDGGQIRVNSLWDGDPGEARYFWYVQGRELARFTNDDMVYMMSNERTYSPIGLSPLETLKMVVDAELSGQEYNRRQVANAAPDGLMDLGEGVRPEQVESFRSFWDAEIAGKKAMAFIGGSKGAKFTPFRNNREMQFMEWQTYLARKIAVVYGLSPQDFGLTFDINRSTSEVQQEQSEDRGLRPLLALVQRYMTREIVWDKGFGGPENNLGFRFTRLNLKETTQKAGINKLALAGVPWKSVNEARREDGREPLDADYDKLMMVTPTGLVVIDDAIAMGSQLGANQPAQSPARGPGGTQTPATPAPASQGK